MEICLDDFHEKLTLLTYVIDMTVLMKNLHFSFLKRKLVTFIIHDIYLGDQGAFEQKHHLTLEEGNQIFHGSE